MPRNESDLLLTILFISLLMGLLLSTITDLRTRRIPNSITLSMGLGALIIHTLLSGFTGVLFSLQGIACGAGLLFLPYLLGGMGAGDVKLLAAVGATLGAVHTFYAFLVIAVIGGLTSIVVLMIRGSCLKTLKNMSKALFTISAGGGIESLRVDRSSLRHKGIPYGAVIAGGTLTYTLYFLVTGEALPPLGI